jgi:hypothetical protein
LIFKYFKYGVYVYICILFLFLIPSDRESNLTVSPLICAQYLRVGMFKTESKIGIDALKFTVQVNFEFYQIALNDIVYKFIVNVLTE